MDELFRPFARLWSWVENVGGFPGQVLFVCLVLIVIIGGLTWFSNRR